MELKTRPDKREDDGQGIRKRKCVPEPVKTEEPGYNQETRDEEKQLAG